MHCTCKKFLFYSLHYWCTSTCTTIKLLYFVQIETGDVRSLPFPSNYFQGIVASMAIHNIMEREFSPQALEARALAIREIARVLASGGRLVIWDIFSTEEYVTTLQSLPDIYNISHSPPYYVFYPSHIVVAHKK